jgi:hypothetical protein
VTTKVTPDNRFGDVEVVLVGAVVARAIVDINGADVVGVVVMTDSTRP